MFSDSDCAIDGFSLNYLHYGDALDILSAFIQNENFCTLKKKKDIYSYLGSLNNFKRKAEIKCIDIIDTLNGIKEEVIDISNLKELILKTLKWRKIFQSLQCRGFSFRFCKTPSIVHSRLRLDIEVSMALVAPPELYYPPKVRNDLESLDKSNDLIRHINRGIGWCLVKEALISGRKWWGVLNIQSDLASINLNSLKELFRGWQRVLMKCLVLKAKKHGVSTIAVPSANSVKEASFPIIPQRDVPKNWFDLYDRTAKFFGMEWSIIPGVIDLQTIVHLPPVLCSHFYVGKVEDLCLEIFCTKNR